MAGTRRQADQLQHAIAELSRILALHPSRTHTLALCVSALRGTDYDRAGGHGGISDPTPQQAFMLGPMLKVQADIDLQIRDVVGAVHRLRELYDRIPSDVDTAAIARLFRCHGVGLLGYDEWGDPSCDRIYKNERGHVNRDHLCDRCRQRRDDWRRKQKAS